MLTKLGKSINFAKKEGNNYVKAERNPVFQDAWRRQ